MEHPKDLFPKGFMWGASTASHQVEGNNHNQWSVWELSVAQQQAKSAQERLDWLPNWDKISNQAQSPDNYISGAGVDHYNRYEEDFDLLKKLNLNTFRFGIEWSRIEPEQGVWNQEAIDHYKDYISELKKRDIEPIMNLWHWTEPVWFAQKGSFKKHANLAYFDNYVRKVMHEFGDDLNYVITLNEPNFYTVASYTMGEFPPQEKSWVNASIVYLNLVKAHKRAYKIIKDKHKNIKVGVATQLANIQAKSPRNLPDAVMTQWMRFFWNWWYLNRIKKQQDFIGFNYYFSDYYSGVKRDNPKVPLNDMGWYMEPEGLYPLLIRVWAHYKKPIIITENGVADETDEYRRWWLEETMLAMERALSEGVDVRGYMHWSLLDNFEWAHGWWPKFGLISVDRAHGMKREIRESAKWFADKLDHKKFL